MWRTCSVSRKNAFRRMQTFLTEQRTPSRVLSRHLASKTGNIDTLLRRRNKKEQQTRETNKFQQYSHGQSDPKPAKKLIPELMQQISSLQQQVLSLEPFPPLWSEQPEIKADDSQRRQLYVKTRQLLGEIRRHVSHNTLRPDGKHHHELSVLLEHILQLYSEIVHSDHSVFKECQDILDLMTTWKLDLQHKHFEYAILAAAREHRWKEASELFWSLIDPQDSGFNPFDILVSNPVGLYAIARNAQERESTVVETVLDAVLRLCIVSPIDEEKYFLAAGTAIGYAGEWETFIDYLKTSYNGSQLGQPLIAAVMHSCLLCGYPDEALQVFDEFVGGNQVLAGEWQWAGGEDRLHPLCRDLAMRSLGGGSVEGAAARALDFYRQVEEDRMTISVEALAGIVGACENEGNWRDAVSFLLAVLDKPRDIPWLVTGDELKISDIESVTQVSDKPWLEMGTVLSTVMRSCNAWGQFGVAMLCFRLFELSIPARLNEPYKRMIDSFQDDTDVTRVQRSLAVPIVALGNTDQLLSAVMVSLCGLECSHEAAGLFKLVDLLVKTEEDYHGFHLKEAYGVYSFAALERSRQSRSSLHPSWETADRRIQRIAAARDLVRARGVGLTKNEARVFSTALATALESCVVAGHPEAGIYLASWVEPGTREFSPVRVPQVLRGANQGTEGTEIPLTDSLLSAGIECYTASGKADIALDLFESGLNADDDASKWILTTNGALNALFSQGRHGDAMSLFKNVLIYAKNPDIFCIVARGLMESRQWDAVADLYRLALTSGCLSEELSVLAMQSVVSSRITRKVRVLRNIAEETAQFLGVRAAAWVETKYFHLKHEIGFRNVRALMFWNDPETSHLDELELALEVFDTRLESGLKPKNDVLWLIVKAAGSVYEGYIPADRTGLPRLPRDRDGWIRTVSKVLKEAENTPLWEDPGFVEHIVLAFRHLDCHTECVQLVNSALSRGVRLKPQALLAVTKAATSDALSDDIKMLTNEGVQ